MSDNVIQSSFASGELSPSLFARVDFAKFRSGAATMRNFFVDYRSGASTRPGTEYVRQASPGSKRVRLVRFQQSNNVSYVLEFGEKTLSFITNDASVVESAKGIAGIGPGTSTIANIPGSGYVTGDVIFVSGGNIPQLANRYYYLQALGGDQFNLFDALTLQPVNSTTCPAYTGAANAQRVYKIATPYTSNELSLLKFSQKANTMNITHPAHPPYTLVLTSATNWALTPAVFGATVGAPLITSVTSTGTGPAYYKYAVTAVDLNNQESVNGNVGLLNATLDVRTDPGTNVILWTFSGPGTPLGYNIYGTSPARAGQAGDNGGLRFIGTAPASVNYFYDSNISPDFSQTPPIHDDPFTGKVFPQCSSYFQQRLVYANGGGNLVQTFWM